MEGWFIHDTPGSEEALSFTITVRNLTLTDKSWLRQSARSQAISMEELVRRLIRRERKRSESRESVADAFKRYFGPENGVDLSLRRGFGYRPLHLEDDQKP